MDEEPTVTPVERPRNTIFAAPADDPRTRRPVDVVTLVVASLVTILAGWIYNADADVDVRVRSFFDAGVPGWITGIATIVYVVGGLYGFALLVGIGFFGHGRTAIARDMVFAAATAAIALVAASWLAGPEWPDLIPELLERDGVPSYPVVRLAMIVSAIRVADPYLSLPMRRLGRWLLIGMSLAAVVLSYGTVSAVIGGLALGVAASSVIHLVFGSGQGIPSRARIVSGLREAGLDVTDVEFVEHQPMGSTLVRARLDDDDDLFVKVYGRDASDAALASRLWRAAWYRDAHRSVFATSQQLAEHESLLLLACERAGVPAPTLIAWSRTSTDDMLLATRWVRADRLGDLGPDDVDDALLDRIWAAAGQLHGAGIAHGAITGSNIVVTAGDVLLADFSSARILADERAMRIDNAQLLVATAAAVGAERAVAAARRSLGDAAVLEALTAVQAAALPRELAQTAKRAGVGLRGLRADVAEALGVEPPELERIQRVSWGNVAMAALSLFAAYSLISALTDIGFDTIAEQMSNAAWGWVVLALVLAQLTNVGEYLSLRGVIGSPIPFGPTILFRYALSFISLAVPSDAGAIAMNVRYQQKLGVPAAAAIAQGPLLTIVSKGFDVLLLAVTFSAVGATVDLDDVDTGSVVRLAAIVVVAAVLAVVVVALVPKLRAKAVPHLREGFGAVKGSLTDPDRLLRLLVGTATQKVLFALTLGASVAAYGVSITFSEAIFVNTAVSLFVGLVPVPGGIGVGEAALAAGLIAVEVPEEAALAAAITHRMVTAYLPPVFGWWASRWLTARDYL